MTAKKVEPDADFDTGDKQKKGGHTFKLGGYVFTTLPDIPPRLLVTYDRVNPLVGFEFYVYVIRHSIIKEDRPKFEEILDNDSDIIVSVDDIIEAGSWIIGKFTGRPTSASSPSSAGRKNGSTTSAETRSGKATNSKN